ncbi:saccharopine dehydrogenase C-terminal domain-containing protein [Pleionea mediterranea]|uniref:Saccharopine dehydrogenase-like NADP-dependent oxidoreductase n=1 Tax=Pleionea mediterranea TaxID=523701 RepID=A0A316FX54_9GAMM|nr:saccharopine dehydrogenase C-terminal domain-containing protein [Pleionea mediterranea]PWK53404.1 saccharopine dehydrogenase-like NADP-dependent oxidoreductase [Pleionea mediterranea]
MDRKILILGAGFVAAPVVEYLNRREENKLTIVSNILSEAEALAGDNSNNSAQTADVTNKDEMSELVQNSDLVISLVPYIFHVPVAKLCIEHKKNLVTASYVSDEMRALEQAARDADVLILNEIGLDPGIDHLSAMKVIDEAHDKGGKVLSFASWCGGLPAPECNDNPVGYKFAWAPRGMLLALLNQASYLKDNQVATIESSDLLASAKPVDIGTDFELEGYPNRDSTGYKDAYKIPEIHNLIRGTLRYKGFSEVFDMAHRLGLLNTNEQVNSELTWRDWLEESLTKNKLSLNEHVKHSFNWLGVDSDEQLPKEPSMLDAFCNLLKQKLQYKADEFDMIALQHKFELAFDDKREYLSSTLVVKGDPQSYSAMSKTVGYPVAIATQLILDGDIEDKGVHIPVDRHFYEPILEGLEQEGIICHEKTEPAMNEHFFAS